MFTQAYFTKRKINKTESKLHKQKQKFFAQIQTIQVLRRKAFSIFNIKGQQQFLDSLLLGATPKDAFVQEKQSMYQNHKDKAITPSMNGKYKEPLSL